MVKEYILVHYSIRDGEIEYGDKALFELDFDKDTLQSVVDLAVIQHLAEDNFGEKDEDWEYNEEDNQVEGCGGEYRILEVEDTKLIPKEHFDVLKIYFGSDIIEV